jgi:hypothetical protein
VTQWHADIDEATMAPGVKLTVLSEHHVVRVITADTLSIQDSSGQCLSAVVVRRSAGDLNLRRKPATTRTNAHHIFSTGLVDPLSMNRDERDAQAGSPMPTG